MSELVERLAIEAPRSEIHGTLEAASLVIEAAARIRELEAENAKMREGLEWIAGASREYVALGPGFGFAYLQNAARETLASCALNNQKGGGDGSA